MENQVEVEREGADITAEHMIVPEETPSEIRKCYNGSTIFLTGGSGFLGCLIIEKLLRVCPDLNKIYVLIRPKKGKSPEERIEELFKDVVYDRLKIENPKYFEKVSLILGDCEAPYLGISEEDREILIDQVNIVIHGAATVRFDEKLRKATHINIRATRDLIKLCNKMLNLKAVVHISTAFSQCIQQEVEEIFYENTEMDGDKLIDLTNLLDDDQLEILTPKLLGKWPNTYTYTKAIAENTIRKYGQNLPLAIIRPSIVTSTYKEPVAGWINNYYGIIGISTGCAIGVLRTLHCNPDSAADLVPADYCINAVITTAWYIFQARGIENVEVPNNVAFDELKVNDNIPIFNVVTSPKNYLIWSEYVRFCENHGLKYPSLQCISYYCFFLNENKYMHLLYALFLHFIPAIIIDTVLFLTGKPPKALKIYKKIHRLSNLLSYFTVKQWNFKNRNTDKLWKKLNKTDKRLFEFDMNQINWNEYFYTFMRGARVYLLKDPLDTLPQAKIRYRKMKILHYTIVTIFYLIVFKLLWMIARSIY